MKLRLLMERLNLRLKEWVEHVRHWRETWHKRRMLRLRQKVLAKSETERLDRIREPWKYRGK